MDLARFEWLGLMRDILTLDVYVVVIWTEKENSSSETGRKDVMEKP